MNRFVLYLLEQMFLLRPLETTFFHFFLKFPNIYFYRDIFHNSSLGVIRAFAIEYLDEMKMNIEQDQKKSEEIKENEIYSVYLYIFSFRYINKLSQIDEIVKF